MKTINYVCFKLEEKGTRSAKKNKIIFVSLTEGKFAMNIGQGKLTSSFCKKLFSCINFLQLLI